MDRKTIIRWIGGGALVGSLLTGGVALQGAFAQTTTPSAQTPPAQTDTKPAPPTDRGPGGRQGGGHLDLVQATAEVTGLSLEEVRSELAAGKTFAAIAEANGKTADDVVDAAIAALKTDLDAKVAAGALTQAQADEKLAQAEQRLATAVTQSAPQGGGKGDRGPGGRGGPHGGPHGGPQGGPQGGRGDLVGVTAEVTGLTEEQVRSELAAGKSLAQVAEANGKTADDIIAALKTKGEEQLATRLEQARQQLTIPGGR